MGIRIRNAGVLISALFSCFCGSLSAQVTVTTYHNDNSRTGQFTQETVLTTSNVNSSQFGKLFSVVVDGYVYAQPLYLSNVAIGGGTHNVIYVATEHDSVYAIDADSGTIYWQVNLIAAGGRTVSGSDISSGCTDIVPEIGITGTPVIDTTSGTIYVVAKSFVGGNAVQYLHAIDIATSAEKFGGPVNIQASVQGTGVDANGTTVSFNPLMELQRPALLLENGHVVIAWSAHCDVDPWHGWVISYGAGSLVREAAFNTSANGAEGGIWMSGGGLAADANGNIYFSTGNGTWNGATDFGDSLVKLGPPSGGSFPVMDYFTPYDQQTLDTDDIDVASGGVLLLPTLSSGRQLLVGMGKIGTIYLVDSNNMGKYCVNQNPACTSNDPQIVQEIANATTGIWGSPAYWNGNLYWTGTNDQIKAFSFNANNSGMISTSPTSVSSQYFSYAAPTPSISANGTSNGILWGVDGSYFNSTCSKSTNCTLYAYDATNLAHMLYNSGQAANNRDALGSAVKYATPIIANGKVYVGNQYAVSVYGELGTADSISAPTLSLAPGNYTSAQTLSLSDTTPGAVIYYTTNGTMPTIGSTQYSVPLQISVTTTIEAIAVVNGSLISSVSGAAYSFTLPPGNVPVSLSTAGDVDGLVNNGSTVSGGGLDGAGNAYSETLTGSSVTWSGATFSLGAAGTLNAVSNATIALPAGNDSSVSLLATAVNGNQANQTFVVTYTDGTTTSIVQSLSDWFTPQNYVGETKVLTTAYRDTASGGTKTGPFYLYGYTLAVNAAKTVKSITLPANRNVVVLAVNVSPSGSTPATAASPTFSPAPGGYASAQPVTLSDTTPGAVIYYTTNGTMPTTGSARYSVPLQISATTTIEAIAVASGDTNSAVASATYTISSQSTGPSGVSLTAVDNVDGLVNNGSTVSGGGLDTAGNAYSETLTGSSVSWSGATFSLGAAGTLNAVSNATIALPAGNDSSVSLLATAVNGNQANQTFVVTYTDGTTTSIVQSLSDWFTPQNYVGETKVLTTAYRDTASGGTKTGPFYLYGYTLAVNAAKTAKSITLPANRNVVVLAIDVSSSGSTPVTAASPTFSPAPGGYTSAQPVTLSDTTPGAVIYYTTNGTMPTTGSARYSVPLQISATTTIEAIAVASGDTNSAVASATYTITASQGTTPLSVNLSTAANVYGLFNNGSAVTHGGVDGGSDAYSANLTGASISWSGAPFSLGAAATANAASSTTIALPAGNFSTLELLATGVHGGQVNQAFMVTYTDGTTSTFEQSLSDWFSPQGFSGESIALSMAYRVTSAGATQNGPFNLYGYSFAINSAKTVRSITLPNNRNVVVISLTLSP